MNIFVSIDGVLRNTIQKFEYHYIEHFLNSDTDGEEVFSYAVTPPIQNDNLLNHFSFQDKEEFENFLFIEFPLEIFGHAGLSYGNPIYELNKLMFEHKDDTFTVIGMDELGKAKPSTLFFLSKNGFLGPNIRFIKSENIDKEWKKCDVWITDDKRIVDLCPKRKKVYKFNTIYNKFFTNKKEINKLSEITKL